MAAPGFSISELIQMIDNGIRFVILMKDAPAELQSLTKAAEFAYNILSLWPRLLQEYANGFSSDEILLLERVKSEYEEITTEIGKFIERHRTVSKGSFRAKVKWVVGEHFLEERSSLLGRLNSAKQDISMLMGFLNVIQKQRMNQHERETLSRFLAQFDLTAVSALALGATQPPAQSGNSSFVPSTPSLSVAHSSITAVTLSSPTISQKQLLFDGVTQIYYRGQTQMFQRRLERIICLYSDYGCCAIELVASANNGKKGLQLVHRASFNRTRLGDTINPEGAELVRHLQKNEPRVGYAVRFINHHELILLAKDEVVSTGAMEYSFQHDRDYKAFQTLVRGRQNIVNVQIRTIRASGRLKLCEGEVLQVWTSPPNNNTLRFFKNQAGETFSEYLTSGFRIAASEKVVLSLDFLPAFDRDKLGRLFIEFRSIQDKDLFLHHAQISNG